MYTPTLQCTEQNEFIYITVYYPVWICNRKLVTILEYLLLFSYLLK